jgi:hypothetical protein
MAIDVRSVEGGENMDNQTPRKLVRQLYEVQACIRLYCLNRDFQFAHLSAEHLKYMPKSQPHLLAEVEQDQIRTKLAATHDR